MKAYKVTDSNNKSCTVSQRDVAIKYKVGEWVYPLLPKSKIFVFKSLRAARLFAGLSNHVWLCDVPNLTKFRSIGDYDAKIQMRKFWQYVLLDGKVNHAKVKRDGVIPIVMSAPRGTHVTTRVKLLKKVYLSS